MEIKTTTLQMSKKTENKDNLNKQDINIENGKELNIKRKKKADSMVIKDMYPRARVIFHRIKWSYILAMVILLLLPIYNFPFTSRYGYAYQYRFFLDPELIKNLDLERNLMELVLPIPIYIFLGIFPGILGLILAIYMIVSGFPHFMFIGKEKIRFFETKLFMPIKKEFNADTLQQINVGRKRLGGKAWLFFFNIMFLASMIWYYGFDSVLSVGNWYFFSITQPVWNGTEIAFEINFGEHLFLTVILMVTAGLLIVLFPRRNMVTETNWGTIQFAYSFITVKMTGNSIDSKSNISNGETALENNDESEDQSEIINNPMLKAMLIPSIKIQKLKSIFKKRRNTLSSNLLYNKLGLKDIDAINLDSKESEIRDLGDSFISKEIIEEVKTFPSKNTPKTRLLLYGTGFALLIAIQLIPGFFFGDFLVPFGVVGFLMLLNIFLSIIYYEYYTRKKLTDSRSLYFVQFNRFTGKSVVMLDRPEKIEDQDQTNDYGLFKLIIGGFMVWEMLIVIFNMIEFIGYFITSAWTILHLISIIYFGFLLFFQMFGTHKYKMIKPKAQIKVEIKNKFGSKIKTDQKQADVNESKGIDGSNSGIDSTEAVETSEKLLENVKYESYGILADHEERTIIDELKKWNFTLKKRFKDGSWKKMYLKSLLFFVIPFVFFVVWLVLYLTMKLKFFVYIFI
ncbi:MAG: hypothetical protein ACTSO9_09045 [Candidatus Helarchaeota archaeon]